jgi:hypothetical protein
LICYKFKKGVILLNELKQDGRGNSGVNAWNELRKAGGVAYSPSEISNLLEIGSDERMLSRDEVKTRVQAYFNSCISQTVDEDTGEMLYVWKKNPTKSGLALYLGVSLQVLIDYVNGYSRRGDTYRTNSRSDQKINTADFDLLRMSYKLIEDFYESKLGDNRNNAGTIFWLNNSQQARWSNSQEFTFTKDFEGAEQITASELPTLTTRAAGQLPVIDTNNNN